MRKPAVIGNARGVVGVVTAVVVGGLAGLGVFTFVYAEGGSYFSNRAEVCANCHVMQGHYDAWIKSSHRAVAVCNDCHTPHDFVGKYLTKAKNGFNHSLAFTTMRFHEPIQATQANLAITENACRYCHASIVEAIDRHQRNGEKMSCIRCHEAVGHAL